MNNIPNVLTIAGSDSSSGAGVQADIKTFTALKVYGTCVITNITAQNSLGVHAVFPIPPVTVTKQLEAVIEDIELEAIKIGMLYDAQIIESVSRILKNLKGIRIIVDPVLISSSGTKLLQDSAKIALIEQIFPLADLITPNLPETDNLLEYFDVFDNTLSAKQKASQLQQALGIDILVKGGHGEGNHLTDYLATGADIYEFSHPKIETQHTHGTGCTLSSAISSFLARGYSMKEAVEAACEFTTQCIRSASLLNVGKSYGPVNHLLYSAI
jgi:hydroxymethylpyrimidine/phosphomethylpyrimidine kinase